MPDRAPAKHAPEREITHLLEVYVMPDCPGRQRATTLATLVRAAGIRGVKVRVVELSRPGTVVPECVVASPTWVLDGRRIAFGNPDPDWLLARLEALPTQRRKEPRDW